MSKTKSGKLRARDLQRLIFQEVKRNARKQFSAKQLARKLKVKNTKDSIQAALNQLASEHKIVATDEHRYRYNKNGADSKQNGGNNNGRADNTGNNSNGRGKRSGQYAEGRVDMTRSGAGYIIMPDEEQDIYVPSKRMGTAQDGDKVKVRYWTPSRRRKPEGEVVEVLERSVTHFVGTLKVHSKYAEVVVDQPGDALSVAVHRSELGEAKDGEQVVVQIIDWELNRYGQVSGRITAVLGAPGSSNIEMQAILINNGFNIAFPDDVLAESKALPGKITPQEIHIRRDMREVTTFTIDPLTAKDFDDALSLRHLEDGKIEVGIHIADVSHYVRPNSALDAEAARRSTSVYLVDRVCPMLPERISNELCSLRPHEDKLTFSAVFTFSPKQFKITDRWFGRTVTHSDRRFTYEEAQDIISAEEGEFVDELLLLNKMAKKLRKRRFKNGAIDFDTNEVRFRLDEEGKPVEVYVKQRMDTNMLIEDFMLLANREVATFIHKKEERLKQQIPFVYRVHDEPDMEKVAELANFAAALGYEMDLSSPQTINKSYNKLLSRAAEDPMVKMLSPIAIRTMAKAIYTTNNIGHYGLGFDYYTHFTSPIRRYADVLVHRILDKNLAEGALFKANAVKLEERCEHISAQERKATTAERESIKYKQTEFMLDHVGDEFTGVINGLADFGVFVEVIENYVEGMIPYDLMDEPYDLSSGKLYIKGRRSGKKLKMGDVVRVRIQNVDMDRRRVDMALVEVLKVHEGEEKMQKGKKRSSRRKKG